MEHAGHLMGPVGRVSTDVFDPAVYLRSFNGSGLPEPTGERFYRETTRPDGSLLREYQIVAVDREIEIAPGIFFPAWTFNGQVPGPRCARPRATACGSPSSTRARIRTRFTFTAGIRPTWTARCPSSRSCRVKRSSTSSTPSRSACTCITATPFR